MRVLRIIIILCAGLLAVTADAKKPNVMETIEYVITYPPTGEIITSWGIFTDLQMAIDTAQYKAQKREYSLDVVELVTTIESSIVYTAVYDPGICD
jgi:hypothetical protein